MDNILRKNQQGRTVSVTPLWTAQQWKQLMDKATRSEAKATRSGL
ncbi:MULTISPECIES: hypothetical protein [Pseudoalteromonas]|uniref:Uncharacterized protein n=1 Tax=Pseudoalteromonas haloplanktis TaxID=228 RepID=A0ABU1BEB8_PSEHA|nr:MULTISPECIES: hypothetical protein [Pseudoalteromonas]MDQ9092741.1 hypothetical protein [Pseudoalteromonas haloplanktis]